MYEIGDEELAALSDLFRSKKLFRYQLGNQSQCDQFETEFSLRIESKHAILLSSGTNALAIALKCLEIGPGDEVILPSYTFVATAAAVRMVGAKPVICNINRTLGIDPVDAAKLVTARTKAIIPVHMDGLASDMSGILQLAEKKNLLVIEDCAQALGGSFNGSPLGSLGAVGTFSLNSNKILSAGEGGILVTSNREIYERAFTTHDLASRYNPVKNKLFPPLLEELGMSSRVSEIQGTIMRVQLRRLDGILKNLRRRKQILAESLANVPSIDVSFGADATGDCACSLHIIFSDPMIAAAKSRLLMDNHILCAFPTLRPAHVAWKWINLVDPDSEAAVNAHLLPSKNLMMSTLKYDIDYDLSIDATKALADKLTTLLRI